MTARPNSKRDKGFEKLSPRLALMHKQPNAGAANATTTGFHGASPVQLRRLYIAEYAAEFASAAAIAGGQQLVDVFIEAWNAVHEPEQAPLSTGAVAEQLGVERRTVTDWCINGRIDGAYQTPGGHWRVPATVVERLRNREV